MTNEQAKQEVIKKAFGNHYNVFNPNENGWGEACINGDPTGFDQRGEFCFRPIELRGIEDNNGWIRIEPDGSNLPNHGLFKMCKKLENGEWYTSHDDVEPCDVKEYFLDLGFTHYKPIKEELKPIY